MRKLVPLLEDDHITMDWSNVSICYLEIADKLDAIRAICNTNVKMFLFNSFGYLNLDKGNLLKEKECCLIKILRRKNIADMWMRLIIHI